jgi:hypothetical protein
MFRSGKFEPKFIFDTLAGAGGPEIAANFHPSRVLINVKQVEVMVFPRINERCS